MCEAVTAQSTQLTHTQKHLRVSADTPIRSCQMRLGPGIMYFLYSWETAWRTGLTGRLSGKKQLLGIFVEWIDPAPEKIFFFLRQFQHIAPKNCMLTGVENLLYSNI